MEMLIGIIIGTAVTSAVAAVFFLRRSDKVARTTSRASVRMRDADVRVRDAEERARHAEQRAEAAQLAGGLIHEIKNPLNTLSMNLQLLAEDWEHAETQQERRALKRIQRLQNETDRLARILDEFMTFVRDRKLACARVSINDVIDEVVMFVRPDVEIKGVDLRTAYGDAGECYVDVGLFKQALLNLILNAEEAVAQAETKEIIVRTEADGDGLRIEIIDTGRGIREEELDKVFKAFYSTSKGGTGLGLPTTRRIIEEHGGSLTLHSDHGRGTCFTIYLPTAPAETAASVEDEHDGIE
jgi:two-component system, NtrC family, sensor histidine kinase HydH